MSTPLIDASRRPDVPFDFDVRTTNTDTYRASLRVRGQLDRSSAPVLAETIAGHLRSRRRFLRLDVRDLTIADQAAAHVLVEAHRRLLAARGTLILTGVGAKLERALGSLAGELFTVPPSAYEAPQLPPSPA
jgi:anti-anti-sigma regulatory factor